MPHQSEPATYTFAPGTVWLLTERCRPAWIAVADLLDDDQWHPLTDVAQVMRGAAGLADQTIRAHLRAAGRRRWITVSRGRVRIRDRTLFETALNHPPRPLPQVFPDLFPTSSPDAAGQPAKRPLPSFPLSPMGKRSQSPPGKRSSDPDQLFPKPGQPDR